MSRTPEDTPEAAASRHPAGRHRRPPVLHGLELGSVLDEFGRHEAGQSWSRDHELGTWAREDELLLDEFYENLERRARRRSR